MKAGVLVIAAAIASGVSAGKNHARHHAHEAFHLDLERGLLTTGSAPEPTCGCTTIWTTITGEGTRMFIDISHAIFLQGLCIYISKMDTDDWFSLLPTSPSDFCSCGRPDYLNACSCHPF